MGIQPVKTFSNDDLIGLLSKEVARRLAEPNCAGQIGVRASDLRMETEAAVHAAGVHWKWLLVPSPSWSEIRPILEEGEEGVSARLEKLAPEADLADLSRRFVLGALLMLRTLTERIPSRAFGAVEAPSAERAAVVAALVEQNQGRDAPLGGEATLAVVQACAGSVLPRAAFALFGLSLSDPVAHYANQLAKAGGATRSPEASSPKHGSAGRPSKGRRSAEPSDCGDVVDLGRIGTPSRSAESVENRSPLFDLVGGLSVPLGGMGDGPPDEGSSVSEIEAALRERFFARLRRHPSRMSIDEEMAAVERTLDAWQMLPLAVPERFRSAVEAGLAGTPSTPRAVLFCSVAAAFAAGWEEIPSIASHLKSLGAPEILSGKCEAVGARLSRLFDSCRVKHHFVADGLVHGPLQALSQYSRHHKVDDRLADAAVDGFVRGAAGLKGWGGAWSDRFLEVISVREDGGKRLPRRLWSKLMARLWFARFLDSGAGPSLVPLLAARGFLLGSRDVVKRLDPWCLDFGIPMFAADAAGRMVDGAQERFVPGEDGCVWPNGGEVSAACGVSGGYAGSSGGEVGEPVAARTASATSSGPSDAADRAASTDDAPSAFLKGRPELHAWLASRPEMSDMVLSHAGLTAFGLSASLAIRSVPFGRTPAEHFSACRDAAELFCGAVGAMELAELLCASALAAMEFGVLPRREAPSALLAACPLHLLLSSNPLLDMGEARDLQLGAPWGWRRAGAAVGASAAWIEGEERRRILAMEAVCVLWTCGREDAIPDLCVELGFSDPCSAASDLLSEAAEQFDPPAGMDPEGPAWRSVAEAAVLRSGAEHFRMLGRALSGKGVGS